MDQSSNIFSGCIPALMTPCHADRTPNYDGLVETATGLIETGMRGVVYCGSMGDWPLLTDEQRQEGVRRLVGAGVPVVVGTGAQNPKLAAAHAAHAREVGAAGLMVIPRVMSRGTSAAAQRAHFAGILEAGGDLPAVIYNSPYYGFETKADLFFDLRRDHSNLVGFKEFGGSESLSYAAEHITSGDPDLTLMVGVDTQVLHGFVHCGATGAITGVGNALPKEVLRFIELCQQAAAGDPEARRLAAELEEALRVLSIYDEGPDLVLYYKQLMVLEGHAAYDLNFNESDRLSPSQNVFLKTQWEAVPELVERLAGLELILRHIPRPRLAMHGRRIARRGHKRAAFQRGAIRKRHIRHVALAAGEREILPQWMKWVPFPHENSAQIRVPGKLDPHHVVNLALVPIGGRPKVGDAGDFFVFTERAANPQMRSRAVGIQLVDHLETRIGLEVIEAADVDEVVKIQLVFAILQRVSRSSCWEHNGVLIAKFNTGRAFRLILRNQRFGYLLSSHILQ